MKYLLSSIGLVLFFFNVNAQNFDRHSFTINLGGIHQIPFEQINEYIDYKFQIVDHIGATYRLKLTERHGLRISGNYKQMHQKEEDYQYGSEISYDEMQAGLGYEFIIKKGKIESYVGVDAIVVRSENLSYSWSNIYNTRITSSRFGYGGSMLVGLRYNIFEKLAIGLETNTRYSFNHRRYSTESNYLVITVDSTHYPNFLELNLISAITIKYTI